MKLMIRWAVSTLTLFAAVYLIPGIRIEDPSAWMVYTMMALIISVISVFFNIFLKDRN
jgi:uncharacterized membrane protein YvlD (DUF360 family)